MAPIPGGPKIVQLPDLVVETLTSTKGLGCGPTGYTIELTVKVKNMGAASAIKPGVYYRYYATADPDGLIKEVDEQNNLKKYEQHADAPCPGSTR